MQYSIIPSTDISVSKVCLGTMTFGTPVAAQDAEHLVHYALGQGINFVDTANMYEGYARVPGSAGGVAEEIVGHAISGHRHEYVVATKLGMKVGPGAEDEGTSPDAIRIQLERSLKRLGTDYVDVYYLHRFDSNVEPGAIAKAMGEQMKAGKFRCWGVSNYTADQLSALLAACKAENIPGPALCQPALSLLYPAALEDMLPLCQREGIGVIPYQILQGGLLTGKYHRGQQAPAGSRAAEKPGWMKPMDDAAFDVIERVERDAASMGKTMTQYCFHWALSQPAVISALVGVKREAQIDEAAAAL